MKNDCDICGGRGTIRLPVMQKLSTRVTTSAIDDMMPAGSYRDYPCPECGGEVPTNRVAVMSKTVWIDTAYGQPPLQTRAAEQAAHAIIMDAMDAGHISISKGEPNVRDRTTPITVTLGLVARHAVDSIEKRAAQYQFKAAETVADEACRQIRHWGSFYSGQEGNISKGQACDSVRAALKSFIERKLP